MLKKFYNYDDVGGHILLKLKKTAALLLAAVMAATMCSCNVDENEVQQQITGGYHFHWMDSNLFENIEQMGKQNIKDDFAAAVTYDWAKEQVEDYTYSISSFGEAMKKVVQNKRAILDDKSIQNKNVELVRKADGLFNDWEYRNKMGVEPLKKYLGYIDDIKTLDDVSAYMLDNDKNPFAITFVKMDYSNNEALENYRAMMISKPDLLLKYADEYVNISEDGYKKKDKIEKQLKYLFERCGYSKKDTDNVIKGCYKTESQLIHLDYTEIPDYKTVHPRSEILSLAGSYPFEAQLKHYGITTCDHFMGELSYLDKLETLYTQNNVEDMKAYFKARLAIESIRYLDKEAYDFYMDTNVDRSNQFAQRIDRDPDLTFFSMLNSTALTAAVDQMYLDYYFDQKTYDECKMFVKLIKEKYQIMISENKNLSDASKKAVREKLDKMGENIMKPSNEADFTGVDFRSKEEGGSFLEALCAVSKAEYEHIGVMVEKQYARDFWDIYDGTLSTTVTNAAYYSRQNAIYIRAGILVDPMYSPDAPIEQKLGSVVAVLGHEISHAFDSYNIYFDADGKKIDIVTKEELKKWDDVEDRIGNHFSGYSPFDGCDSYSGGSLISGEVIADAEGVKAALMIAKDYDNFDYDTFFRAYARFWRFIVTKESQTNQIKDDPHPLEFIRVNYTLIQFDEFYETYGIKPGDGMYMDPAERILIW